MTSTLVLVSRLPVGSSASMSFGSLTIARAMATRCCWPPESCEGRWSRRPPEADALERDARPLAPLAPREPRVDERQLDVLEGARAGEQVEALEDEADGPVAHLRELAAAEARDLVAVERRSLPLVGRSRQPRMFMSVDLPEPDAPMMATNSPRSDREAHAVERAQHRVAEHVDLGQVRRRTT